MICPRQPLFRWMVNQTPVKYLTIWSKHFWSLIRSLWVFDADWSLTCSLLFLIFDLCPILQRSKINVPSASALWMSIIPIICDDHLFVTGDTMIIPIIIVRRRSSYQKRCRPGWPLYGWRRRKWHTYLNIKKMEIFEYEIFCNRCEDSCGKSKQKCWEHEKKCGRVYITPAWM